jgi:hypothetical protein
MEMVHGRITRGVVAAATAVIIAAAIGQPASAQRGGGPPPGPPQSPWASAPIDLTGYWVSIVNEDWRWRMVTPPKGDTSSVPLNAEGTKVANAWDPATDGSCLAYGAAGLMRIPTRLHITWENENTLKIETDAGQQTRRLLFDPAAPAPAQKTLQGLSRAQWERVGVGGRGAPGGGAVGPITNPRGGDLKVLTNNLTAGWLRKNGVPYSDNATMTEYYDRFAAPNGDEWLVVTTIVTDPRFLNTDFITSTHFRREPSGAKWDPTPCKPIT